MNIEQTPFLSCLYPLLESLGWHNDDRVVDDAIPYDYGHFDLFSFLQTLANLQYRVTSKKINSSDLQLSDLPALFVGKDGVPLTITKINENAIIYYDGVKREFVVDNSFTRSGTLYRFEFENDDAVSLINPIPQWFFKLLLRFRSLLFISVALSLFMSLISLATPLFVMTIYSQLTIAGSTSNYFLLLAGVTIFIVSYISLKYIRSYSLTLISARMGAVVNKEVIRRLLYLPPSYTEKVGLSSQMARIRDFESIQKFFSGIGISSLLDLPFIVILLLVIYGIGGVVVIVPIITIFMFIVMAAVFIPLSKKASSGFARTHKDSNVFIHESIAHLSELRSDHLAVDWKNRYKTILKKSIDAQERSSYLSELINTSSTTITSIAALATIGVGVSQVVKHNMSAGALIAVILILWKILAPLKTFFSVVSQFDRIKNSISQLDKFMALPLEKRGDDSFQLTRKIKGEISFNQVSIRYTPESYPALLGVSFDVSPGECLVIIGHNGSGKSTILKLLLGMVPPQVGRVNIDRLNIQQQNPSMHRRQIAYCPQDSYLFDDTLANNIDMYCSDYEREDLVHLLKKMLLLEEILDLPEKLDTPFGGDIPFNHHFIRRFSLVRTFLKKSNLMVIDNITQDLGADDLSAVLSILKSEKGKKTTIVTTHDPRVLSIADKALWLDRGRVRLYDTGAKVKQAFLEDIK